MNELLQLGLTTKHEKVLVSSRIIAEKFEKEHAEVLKRIHGYDRNNKHVNGLIDDFEPSVNTLEYFILGEYKDASGKANSYSVNIKMQAERQIRNIY